MDHTPRGSDYHLHIFKFTKVKTGRYFAFTSLGTNVVYFIIHDIQIQFADHGNISSYSIKSNEVCFLLIVDPPPLKDCAELYRAGFIHRGWFLIDPYGTRDWNKALKVHCENGWTNILHRPPEPLDVIITFITFSLIANEGNCIIFRTHLKEIGKISNGIWQMAADRNISLA